MNIDRPAAVLPTSEKMATQGSVNTDSTPCRKTEKSEKQMDGLHGSKTFALDPSEEYNMNHTRRGLALIFNQENFFWHLRLPNRNGTNADRQNLEDRFKCLGFEVRAFDNLKQQEVLNKINDAANEDHVDEDCFVCVFLSHGESEHVYAYDGKIFITDLTDPFKGDKCKSLVGKPKIFILQACRGDQHDVPVTPMDMVDSVETTNTVVVDAGVIHTLPAGADFIMCYSVAEGYYSHRETVNGSWYIQDLCEVFKVLGESLELTELLTLVNRKVSMRSVGLCADRSAIGKKQVPCFASMLTKKLYFHPQK